MGKRRGPRAPHGERFSHLPLRASVVAPGLERAREISCVAGYVFRDGPGGVGGADSGSGVNRIVRQDFAGMGGGASGFRSYAGASSPPVACCVPGMVERFVKPSEHAGAPRSFRRNAGGLNRARD